VNRNRFATSFVIPNRLAQQAAAEVEEIGTSEEVQAAIQRRKERVLIPVIFRERVTDGTSTYIYSLTHQLEDIEEYKKQLELSKQDVSMLEYLQEGEVESGISGKDLVERYAEQSLTEREEKARILRDLTAGKDLVPEHPVDVFYKVTDPHTKTFQDCWHIVKHFQYKKFFPPGRNPLMTMLERSRTRRHFVRTLEILQTYERKGKRWLHEDKIRLIEWSRKHAYASFMQFKFNAMISNDFFNTQQILERYMSFLFSLPNGKSVSRVIKVIKARFGSFTKEGYHWAIHGHYKRKDYETTISLFKELLFDSKIQSFSLSLWDATAKAMISSQNYEGLDEIVAKLKQRFLFSDAIVARQGICLIANGDLPAAKKLFVSPAVKTHAKSILANWHIPNVPFQLKIAQLTKQFNSLTKSSKTKQHTTEENSETQQ